MLAAGCFHPTRLLRMPDEIGLRFTEYLGTLPWTGNALDENAIPHAVSSRMDALSDAAYWNWIQNTAIGEFQWVGIAIAAGPPFGLVPLVELKEPEELILGGRETYCFGCSIERDVITPDFGALLEVSIRRVLATRRDA